MKEEIIQTAAELFLNLGFKSVTMDDIANKMGISKKTIYTHFTTKSKLVEASTHHIMDTIEEGIANIFEKDLDAIGELFEIKRFVMNHLKDEKSSPQFQLGKYYPKIYKNLERRHFNMMNSCVINNLEKGMEGGLFRPSLSPAYISKFYFIGITAIKNQDLFPPDYCPVNLVTEKYLEYHLRSIVTPKGFEQLKKYLTIED